MNKLILLILPFLLFSVSVPIYADDFQAGINSFERGDYKTAFKKLMPLAEQGNATAQYNLGIMYGNGEGVPQDYVEAHKWFNLAGANGVEMGRENREIIEKLMTGEQITEAQGLARDWMEKHPQE